MTVYFFCFMVGLILGLIIGFVAFPLVGGLLNWRFI